MISNSIVNNAVSVCNFDTQIIGQSDTKIKKPVRLFAHAGSITFSCPYNPAKSLLGYTSTLSDLDAFNMRPLSLVSPHMLYQALNVLISTTTYPQCLHSQTSLVVIHCPRPSSMM
ncbi:hypothetical protein ACHAW6_001964 [Cyclotella cf. meneghiniana]